MDIRSVFLLFVLGASWSCCARIITTNPLPTRNPIISVLQTIHHLPKGELEITEGYVKNDRVCTLCEEFSTMALDYIAKNKTETEIISILHNTCSKVLNFKQQCMTLVDYYAPLFFLEVSSVNPEAFCQKVGLCQQIVSTYRFLSKNSCLLCHQIVTETLLKLKDPDTQLDIVEYLLKACDALEGYKKKCKKLVFEYAPLILVNAEEFLEKNDLCLLLHACDPAATSIGQIYSSYTPSHSAS